MRVRIIRKISNRRPGDVIGVHPEIASRLVAMGYAEAEAATAPPPAPNANKAAWIDYAVSQGADETAVSEMTKRELIARFGGADA